MDAALGQAGLVSFVFGITHGLMRRFYGDAFDVSSIFLLGLLSLSPSFNFLDPKEALMSAPIMMMLLFGIGMPV